ncbi:hypothetical protein ACHWQZ_G002543 [Mnemiopsis leidyi]
MDARGSVGTPLLTSRTLCRAEAAGLQEKPGVIQPLTLGHGGPRAADDYRSIEAEESTTTSLATAVEEQLLTSPTKTSSDTGRITPVFPESEQVIDALGTGAEDSRPYVPDVEESPTAGSGVSVIRLSLKLNAH